jgi:hypothetical protein
MDEPSAELGESVVSRKLRRRTVWLLVLSLVAIAWLLGRAWDYRIGNRTMSFYGRVCDPQGVAVAGAVVQLRIVTLSWATVPYVPFSEDTSERYITVTSNSRGDFEVLSAHGCFISVERITKPGYGQDFVGRDKAFSYSYYRGLDLHRPDAPEKRVTYTLIPVPFISQE